MPHTNTRVSGLLIGFMGLPGSGKSTTARELSALVEGAQLFAEPDDSTWPLAVSQRHEFGYFSALTWFRSMRVPLLHMAHKVRDSGGVAVVDSYYDKLISDYLDHPEMRWLFPPEDSYYKVLEGMALLDKTLLPNVDCLVFLRVTPASWHALLSTRRREMDRETGFLKSFPTQQAFLLAAQSYSQRTKTHLLVHDQQVDSPHSTAEALLARLQAEGII